MSESDDDRRKLYIVCRDGECGSDILIYVIKGAAVASAQEYEMRDCPILSVNTRQWANIYESSFQGFGECEKAPGR